MINYFPEALNHISNRSLVGQNFSECFGEHSIRLGSELHNPNYMMMNFIMNLGFENATE